MTKVAPARRSLTPLAASETSPDRAMGHPRAQHGPDLLTIGSLSAAQIRTLFLTAAAVKSDIGRYSTALSGRSIILLFEKPSLRTRVTFEVGPAKMGAHTMYFDHSKERIGQRESIRDYGRNLERWVDCVVARTYSHETLEQLAEHCDVPVINALSDLYHPCQALADLFTLWERFRNLQDVRIAWVGDGNNVCASLMHGAAKLGAQLTVVTPRGFEPREDVVEVCRRDGGASGATLHLTHDVAEVSGAHAVYTDVWTSMGSDGEAEARRRAFEGYQVNEDLMAKAGADTLFMHCLPAKRGEEVTDGVIDSPNSIVYDQAENRMHIQNSLLLHTLGGARHGH
jgi:ornithine carbamoyltransferase